MRIVLFDSMLSVVKLLSASGCIALGPYPNAHFIFWCRSKKMPILLLARAFLYLSAIRFFPRIHLLDAAGSAPFLHVRSTSNIDWSEDHHTDTSRTPPMKMASLKGNNWKAYQRRVKYNTAIYRYVLHFVSSGTRSFVKTVENSILYAIRTFYQWHKAQAEI